MVRHYLIPPYRYLLFFLLPLLFPFPTTAQEDEDKGNVEKKIDQAIEAGNASKVAEHFTKKVDLSLPGTDDVYSKAQAEQILKEFFQEHPPEELVLEHQGTSRLKDRYHIGKLSTKEKDFRVTYFMKQMDSGTRIKKLRIENYEEDP